MAAASQDIAPAYRNLGLPDKVVDSFVEDGALTKAAMVRILRIAGPLLRALFGLLRKVPAHIRQRVVTSGWRLWVVLHRRVLPASLARRGLSSSISVEAHALSNLVWWARLLPLTPRLIRDCLSLLDSLPAPVSGVTVERVDEPTVGVSGAYLRLTRGNSAADGRRALFWCFGGAFVGGTVEANLGLAAHYAERLGCDVFVPHLRQFPEHLVTDQFEDGCRAYEWLLSKSQARKVVALGFSSGAGCLLRALQLARSETERRRFFTSAQPLPMPAGAALLGPFVDYRIGIEKVMRRNGQFDLVVSPQVVDCIAARMGDMCGGEDQRSACSPLMHPMEGLCPLLVTSSQHEACWVQDLELVERAKAAGLEVELHARPFLPHVYPIMYHLLPEAQAAEDEIVAWLHAKLGAAVPA